MEWNIDVFIKNLTEQMEKNGITKRELADLCEVSPASVTYWFNGSFPRIDKIQRIAEILHIEVHELLEDSPTIYSVELSQEEKDIVLLYRKLDSGSKEHLKQYEKFLVASVEKDEQ